jgi:hypothetical protein
MAETVTIRPGRLADAAALAEQHREPNPPYPDQVWMRRDPR